MWFFLGLHMSEVSLQRTAKDSCAIVFVNYNTSSQIIEAIRSLCDEPVGKIIVVDNASPNDEPECIATVYPDVELIKLARNVGFGEGCNIGANWVMQHTACTHIFFLNPDTQVEQGCLTVLRQRFVGKDVGIVVPRITTMGGEPTLWYGGGYMNWWKGSASIPGFGGAIDSPSAMQERDVEFASGCALLISCDVLKQCGGFDSRYFMYEEDVEFSLRILACGFRIRYIPEAIVRHACQGSMIIGKGDNQLRGILNPKNLKLPFYVELIARNRWYTVWSHGSAGNKIKYAVVGTIWWLSRAMLFVRHGRFDAVQALTMGWFSGFKVRK